MSIQNRIKVLFKGRFKQFFPSNVVFNFDRLFGWEVKKQDDRIVISIGIFCSQNNLLVLAQEFGCWHNEMWRKFRGRAVNADHNPHSLYRRFDSLKSGRASQILNAI